MAYDAAAAERVRDAIAGVYDVRETRMMGALVFLLGGHMCCGVVGAALMVRVGADAQPEALREPHVRPMKISGQTLQGFVLVEPDGYATAPDLARWIGRGLAFAASLPEKPASKRRPARR